MPACGWTSGPCGPELERYLVVTAARSASARVIGRRRQLPQALRGLARDERGTHLVEYVLLVGLVAIVSVAGARAFGGAVKQKAEAQGARVTSLEGQASHGLGYALAEVAAAPPPPPRSDGAGVSGIGGALPPPPAASAAPPSTDPIIKAADEAFSAFHGKGEKKKGIDFWMTQVAGQTVAFGFTAGLAIDSDAATNVVRTKAAFEAGTTKYIDPDYQSGTTVKFTQQETVVEKGKSIVKTTVSAIPANEIPYVALPPTIYMPRNKNGEFIPGSGPMGSNQVRPGDFVRVTLGDKTVYAIFVDGGPRGEVGEASMAVATALGLSDNPRSGGTEEQKVKYEILPGSGPAQAGSAPGYFKEAIAATTYEQIQRDGAAAFKAAEDQGRIRKNTP